MKITSIKQQVKDPERVSVSVDGRYAFSLSLSEVVSEKIKNGQELTAADVKRFKKLSEDGRLRLRTLEWLLNRPHSERELRDYLRRKKVGPELADAFVSEFKRRRYLDDKAFASWFSENRARKNKSNRAIVSELYSKGISREIINELTEAREKDEAQRLAELVAKKRKSSRYKNDPEKLARYLVQQGYSWSQVKEQLLADGPEQST